MQQTTLLSLVLVSSLAGCGFMEAFNAGLYEDHSDDSGVDADVAGDDDDDDSGPGPGPGDDDDTTPPGDDDDTTPPTTQPCVPPNVNQPSQGPAGGTNLDPAWVGFWMDGIVDGTAIEDFAIDGAPVSAWFYVGAYDASFNLICQTIFDASTMTSTTAPWSSNGGVVYKAWNLNLVANSGWTDCPSLNTSKYGTTDMRVFVANKVQGFGYGELDKNYTDVKSWIDTKYPGTWNADWGPHVFGTYVKMANSAQAWEIGFAFQFADICYDVTSGSAALAVPAGPAGLNGYIQPDVWTVLDPEALP